MEMQELTLEKFEDASEIVRKVTQETKLIYSEYFSEKYGNKIYFKPENMQRTGAYKVRGAYYKISQLSEEEREHGLITASAGNHAQGVAYAAKLANVKATVVMPVQTPLIKVNRTRSYGANVVLFGDVFDEACSHAYELARENGYTFADRHRTGQYRHGNHKRTSHGGLHSGSRGRRRTLYRRFHPGETFEPED